MHSSVFTQHACVALHASPVFEQRGWAGVPHVPSVQNPAQQSKPDVQDDPLERHGSSAVKARWFPVPSSCPVT
jgi:hypothetical protein